MFFHLLFIVLYTWIEDGWEKVYTCFVYNINKVEDPFLFTTQMQSAPSVFYMTFTILSVFCGSSLFNLFQARLQIIQ